MRIVIFSDTHLTRWFDRKKFNLLKQIISDADQVIINGDFWDRFWGSFDDVLNSQWQPLFPLLKKKKAIYLYGNHDPAWASDKRISLFCVKAADSHRISVNGVVYRIEHGDKIVPSLEMSHPWLFDNRVAMFINRIANIIGTRLFSRAYLYIKNNGDNAYAKKWAVKHLKKNEMLVIGHTHLQEIDTKARVAVTGMVEDGMGQYLVITEDSITAVSKRY